MKNLLYIFVLIIALSASADVNSVKRAKKIIFNSKDTVIVIPVDSYVNVDSSKV